MSTDSKMTREQVLAVLDDAIDYFGDALAPAHKIQTQQASAAVDATYDEVERLRAFAQALFEEMDWPEGGDLDGFAFQELATRAWAATRNTSGRTLRRSLPVRRSG